MLSKLALRAASLNQASAIAQNRLSLAILGDKPDFLETILDVAHSPSFRRKLVTRLDRRRKPGLELPEVVRITAA